MREAVVVFGAASPVRPGRGSATRLARPVRADYHQAMFLDGLSFLEEEREAFRPFEALLDLTDQQLGVAVATAHGWSGRDLMAHLVAWQTDCLAVARELAVGDTSPRKAALDADWEARGGEVVNAEIQADWASRPLSEVREQFRTVAGELRGTLTVVPEARWIKNPDHMRYIVDETLDHYDEHRSDLAAILAAAGRS